MGINTRQSGDTSIVLSPSQSYDEETNEEAYAPVIEPTTPVSPPAFSIDERIDRIKTATIADTVPTIYNEDEHANDVTAEHGAAISVVANVSSAVAPSEDTDEMDYQVMPKAG